MRIVLLLCALAATPVLANQPIWKWVDERGVTHYSDRPVPGATQVNVTTAPRSTDGRPRAQLFVKFVVLDRHDADTTGGYGIQQIRDHAPAGGRHDREHGWRSACECAPRAQFESRSRSRPVHRRQAGARGFCDGARLFPEGSGAGHAFPRGDRAGWSRPQNSGNSAHQFHRASGVHCKSASGSLAQATAKATTAARCCEQVADEAAFICGAEWRCPGDRSGNKPAGEAAAETRRAEARQLTFAARSAPADRSFASPRCVAGR